MKKIWNLVYWLFWIIFGGVIGYLFGEYIGRGGSSVSSIWLLIWIVLAFVLQIAIHEAGHLVFGLLTGYQFLSYRLFSFLWQKHTDGKVRFSFYSLLGTLGQCLMSPPKPVNGKIPYVLYNLGGGFANLLSIFFFELLKLPGWFDTVFLDTMSGVGLLLAMTNLIPFSDLISNDGANVLSIKKSPKGSLYFYSMLEIHTRLAQGVSWRDMDTATFIPVTREDLNNSMAMAMALNTISRKIDEEDFIGAREYIMQLELLHVKTTKIYQVLIKGIAAYCDLMLDSHTAIVFSKQEWKIIFSLSKSQPSILVFLYAYSALVEKDIQKAEQYIKQFYKLKKTHPLPVEYQSEERNLVRFQEKI